MKYEVYTCIDAGSRFCPCHLAESGQCILCSQITEGCCNCTHWSGTCIYQELVWNNLKAKEGRKYYNCKIVEKSFIEEDILKIAVEGPYELVHDLKQLGSFVFLKSPLAEEFFNSPISVMDVDLENNIMHFIIEVKGVKTKDIANIEVNREILVKGPFWNGILGIRHLMDLKDKTCILIARGIGQAPMIPVLKELSENGNKVIVIKDKGNLKEELIEDYLNKYAYKVYECKTLEKGVLTRNFKEMLIDKAITEKPVVIHCDGADVLNYEVMKLIDKINEALKEGNSTDSIIEYSCCNNAKMCCGEGVCGACTRKNNDRKLRRLCKMQTDPKYVLEGRRLF